MESVDNNASEHPSKSGLGRVVAKADSVLFGHGTQPAPGKQDIAISPELKNAGLQELRDVLGEEITLFRRRIDEAREYDNRPRGGLGKVMAKIDRLADDGSREDFTKNQNMPHIQKRIAVMEAINRGDEAKAVGYLTEEIKEAIRRSRMVLMATEDRSSERAFRNTAQKYIRLLGKIDPKQAANLQENLDGKTGNPLRKL